jgi:glycosyltransferase involved in cell wall biosynthesis
MQTPGKILIATQFYPPDSSTTATYIAAIAEELAIDNDVVVLSGSPPSQCDSNGDRAKPKIVRIKSSTSKEGALLRRAVRISVFALRMFFSVLVRARPDDVVFCVTTPFTLPYSVFLAAKLRGAVTVLLVYDLYPEAIEAAGLISPSSLTARALRLANQYLFRSLDAIITIGRDVQPLLLAYEGVSPKRIHFVPNWTLLPIGYREIAADSRFRAGRRAQLVVGLSGNLGFTHSPRTVFETARLLENDGDVHFLLSGWGRGWKELCDLQTAENLDNVTLVEPVPQAELVELLSAADVWIVPYRRNMVGVSIPSRLYNLLAVGRAIIVAAETNSEAALVVNEEQIGWVVPPEDPHQLAHAIRLAAADRLATTQMSRRAAVAAESYAKNVAVARYREVILNALGKRTIES